MIIQRQLRRVNAFGFFSCVRIYDVVWVVLLYARGFSLWQIGLAEGIFHVVSLLCEIPSGMAADLLGRRRTLMAAGLLGAAGSLCMVFSHGFFGVCLSMALSALAYNFISGSDEALLYDSLLQAEQKERYLAANAKYTQIQNVGYLLSNAGSLLLGWMGYVEVYLVDAGVCLLRSVSAGLLTEPTVTASQTARQEQPFRELGSRFREHVGEAVGFLRQNPRTAVLMLSDGLMGLPSYLTTMFLQQRLNELGFAPMFLGLPVLCVTVFRMAGLAVGKRLRPQSLARLYGGCALLVGVGTFAAGAAPILPAVLGAMVAAGSMDAWMLHLQKRLNERFPSDQRATLVSVNAMAYSLLMIAASPLVGWLGDIGPSAGTGLCALGGLVAAAGVLVLLFQKK